MENNKMLDLIIAGLTFNRSKLNKIGKEEGYTSAAIWLIIISIAIDTVIAYFKGNGGSSGLARTGLTGINAAIGELGSVAIGTFLSAYVMVYVIRIFKAKPTFNGVVRIYGAGIIWEILKSIIVLLLPSGLAMVGVLFWLAYNFVLLFGLTELTKIKLWKSFVSIVLTFIVIFIIMIVYGFIVKVTLA